MARNTPIIKDWFMLGLLTGAGASIAKTATERLLEAIGLPAVEHPSVAAALVLGKRARMGVLPNHPRGHGEWATGYIADTLIGGIFGIGLSYVIAKTPPGNELAKGATAGAAIWAGTFSIGKMLSLDGLNTANYKQMNMALAVSILYGAIQGIVLGRYGAKLIDQSHPILTKEVTDEEFEEGRLDTHGSREPEYTH